MDIIDDNFDAEFEDLYRRYLAAGGFTLPALAEDWERDMREDRDRHKVELCVHGSTRITCPQCYFDGFRPKW
jgi:hypothetical protein